MTIKNPAIRQQYVDRMVRAFNLDLEGARIARLAVTPKPLLVFPDHARRGKKSLTRIQQLSRYAKR